MNHKNRIWIDKRRVGRQCWGRNIKIEQGIKVSVRISMSKVVNLSKNLWFEKN